MVNRHSDSGWLVHIGAGRSSLRTLRHAREHGYRTLAIDVDPNAPGFAEATVSIERSREDLDGILDEVRSFANERALAGCWTTSSASSALAAAAAIREEYDLPGLRQPALDTLADRSTWKDRLRRNSIETPPSALLSSVDELGDFLGSHASVLVKPESGGRGSLGVARLRRGEARSRDLYYEAQETSNSELVLAEAFISGDEYSIDGVVRDGDFRLLHLGRKFSARNHRGTLPTGYAWGASRKNVRSDEDPRWPRSRELASAVCRALDMNDTFVSLDVIDDGDQIHVIDVGCQLDAKVDLGLEFSGIEVAGLGHAIATGDPLQFSNEPGALTRGFAIRFFYSDTDGRLQRLVDPDSPSVESTPDHWHSIAMSPFRYQIEWEKDSNEPIARPRSVADLVVSALVEGEDRNCAWMRSNEMDSADLFSVEELADPIAKATNEWNPDGPEST